MYYCLSCKKIIDEDDIERYEEPSEAWGHTVYEEWSLCPYCHEPIESDILQIPCLYCDNNDKCRKSYVNDDELLCEIGESCLEYWDEVKEDWEYEQNYCENK